MAKRSKILHRSLSTSYGTAMNAEGCYVRDAQGRQYIDASGGAAVSCLGHSHPRVVEAMKRQMEKLQFIHSSFFTSDAAEALAERLASAAPGGKWRAFFVSGGSEATEAALKLCRQLWVERGEPRRDHFFSRWQSYPGNTLGALSVSGNKGRRALYDPLLLEKVKLALPCFAYRHQSPDESEADYARRAADSLDRVMGEAGHQRAIGFIAETVVGATLGAAPAAPGYFKRIREICDRQNAFFVADEVMCGMGRCGAMFAIEDEGIQPDMITLAKGLGGGYQPIGALLVREELVEELKRGSGVFQHGHTYIGHSIAAAAALEVQKVIEEEALVERAAHMGRKLKERLQATFGGHPHVGDIRGRGLLLALEVVEERQGKRPFPAERKLWAKIKSAGLEEGLICYPSGGTADGVNGDHVLLAPPYIVEDAQLDEIVEKLARAIDRGIEKTT
jgi:adenosylmethionine-8-amino-7-oxononanoate aminotransferase